MIAVAVIAQSPAIRAGLRVLLATDDQIKVVGDGTTLGELQHTPLRDAEIAVVHGVPTQSSLASDKLRGMLFIADDWDVIAAPQAAPFAWGVVPGDATAEELIAAVGALYQGLIVLHPHVAATLVVAPGQKSVDNAEPLVEPLTGREHEVLQLIGQGLANKMIADRLRISEHTVKFHVSAIYAKLGVASRTEAVRAGARRGLIVL
jgi:DNA-binding NarL/FixJ family response regulator